METADVKAASPAGRYRQLVRCLRLRRMVLGRSQVNVHALANQLRVSSRTIRRDLAALSAAGEAMPRWREKDMAL
jgi:predicted DNA-binding transcriptional regulator YafY